MSNEAREAARDEFVWNMHTDYSGVANEAFDGGWDAGVAEGIRQAREAVNDYYLSVGAWGPHPELAAIHALGSPGD